MKAIQTQRPIVRQQQRLAQKNIRLCPTCKAEVEVVGGKMINADNGKTHVCPPHPTKKWEPLTVEAKPLVAKVTLLTFKREPLVFLAKPLVAKVTPLTFKREPLVFLAKPLGKQGK